MSEDENCKMCGRTINGNQTVLSEDLDELRLQIETLHRRLGEFETKEINLEELENGEEEICLICKSTIFGNLGSPSPTEIEQRVLQQITRLEGRIDALERKYS